MLAEEDVAEGIVECSKSFSTSSSVGSVMDSSTSSKIGLNNTVGVEYNHIIVILLSNRGITQLTPDRIPTARQYQSTRKYCRDLFYSCENEPIEVTAVVKGSTPGSGTSYCFGRNFSWG